MALEVNQDNFNTEVVAADRTVLVDFWGPSCQNCLALMSFIDKIAEKYKDKLKVVKVDSSKNRQLCIKFRVMSLPTFLVLRSGQEIGRISGKSVNEQEIVNFVNQNLS